METTPQPAEIKGVVLDAAGSPVSGARVHLLEGPVPVADIATLTDRDGRFGLFVPIPGTYVLGVAGEVPTGFINKTIGVEVPGTRAVDVEVNLAVA